MSDSKSNCPGGAGLEKELARMPATTSGKSDKADDSIESTQNLLYRQHVTTTNPTVCANLGVLNPSKFKLKDGDPEGSSGSSDKKNFTKVEFLYSLVYACRLCDVGNCDRDSCVEFRKTLEKYNPCCGNWRDLEKWALQLAACICSQKDEAYRRGCCKLPPVFTSMDSLVDKYRGEYSSEDPAETFAWANGVELSDVLGVLAWLNGIMTGRYEVIQESNRLQKDNAYDEGGVFDGQIMEAVDRANKYKLCLHRVWAVARSLPGGELNLPALVPPGMDSGVVAHEDHDRCTFDFCWYSRKDFTAQGQRHECLAKNCELLTFPQQKLVEPALARNPTAWKLDGQSIIEPNQPFMAISHVWADGTGAGPWEAGRVNECLYGFFCGIAEQFQCEGIWWDTISIPREDKKARNEAINNLQSNYIDARITLIHDLYLRKWEWVDVESACFAVVMSMWFSRGWTSLELVKSGRVKVLFKSGSTGGLIVKDLDEDILAKPGEPSSPWRQVATAAIFNLRRKRIMELNDILTALGSRDTSWPEDVAIISRLLAGVEVPVHASQQDIYQEILRKIKQVYHGHLFQKSATMKKSFSWCPSNLFDMPLAMTSKLGSTPLRIQENGDVVGNWRVFSVDAFCWKDYVWTEADELMKRTIRSAMKNRKKHLFLVEEGSITRALLVKMFREREEMPPQRRIHCQFVGPVYFTLPQRPGPSEDGVEIEVRIGDMEGMDEVENEKAAFDYVHEMACESGMMLNAENKESEQMWPENKLDKNARLVLDLFENAVSEGEYPETTLHAAAEKGYASVVRLLLDEKKNPNLNVQDLMGRTALLLAAANGNEEVVELLLKRKADPNVADYYDRTPLQRAARGGSKAMVEQLLQSGANQRALDKLGESALLLAAERGEEEVVQILLEQAANANVSSTEKEEKKQTTDANAVQTVLHRAAWGGSKAVVRLLLERGFKPDTKDKDGQTALHVAVERGHMSVVRVILEKNSEFANVTNAKGQTALFEAAKNGHKDRVELLLMKGANPNFKDDDSRTALFEAAKNGHKDIVQLLLMKGAEPDFKDANSRTALSLAAEHGHKAVVQLLLKGPVELDQKDRDDKVPLVYAAAGGHLDIVQLLLDSKGVDGVYFRTALVEAVKGGHDVVFKLLLDKGTGIGSKGESETLLRLAAGGGHKSLVQLLLDKGVDFDSKDQHAKTPLYYAIYGGHKAVVTLLLLKNVDVHFEDEERAVLQAVSWIHFEDAHRKTLLLQAASRGYDAMARLLLENCDCKYEHYSTLINRAAIHGHDALVELLLRKIMALSTRTTSYIICVMADVLYSAARGGHEAVVRLLLRKWLGRDLWELSTVTLAQRVLPEHFPTALRIAGENGKELVVQLLLDEGTDVNSITNQRDDLAKNEHGGVNTMLFEETAHPVLHHAAMNGHEGVVRILLARGADIDYRWNFRRQTALHFAAENGHEAIARLLIEKGAHIEASFYTEDRPRDRGSTALHLAVRNGHHRVVKTLIDEGVDINKRRYDSATALHVAAKEGHEVIARLLIKKGAELNQWDCEENTALSLAAVSGHKGIVRLLIESGAEVNKKNYQGNTALSLAALSGHEGVVRILLERGANIDYQSGVGEASRRDCRGQTVLHIAAENGDEAIARLLIEKGAHLEASFYTEDRPRDGGSTALHLAVGNGHYRVAKMLIDEGVDINNMRYDKATALHVAAKEGHEVIARLLIKKGAEVNRRDCEGNTALSLAALSGHRRIVRLLIKSGAEVNRKNYQGNTALSLAVQSRQKGVAQVLIESGAEINEVLERRIRVFSYGDFSSNSTSPGDLAKNTKKKMTF